MTPGVKLSVRNGCMLPAGQQPPSQHEALLSFQNATLSCLFLDFNEQGVKDFGFRIEGVPKASTVFYPFSPSAVWLPCSCHWPI